MRFAAPLALLLGLVATDRIGLVATAEAAQGSTQAASVVSLTVGTHERLVLARSARSARRQRAGKKSVPYTRLVPRAVMRDHDVVRPSPERRGDRGQAPRERLQRGDGDVAAVRAHVGNLRDAKRRGRGRRVPRAHGFAERGGVRDAARDVLHAPRGRRPHQAQRQRRGRVDAHGFQAVQHHLVLLLHRPRVLGALEPVQQARRLRGRPRV